MMSGPILVRITVELLTNPPVETHHVVARSAISGAYQGALGLGLNHPRVSFDMLAGVDGRLHFEITADRSSSAPKPAR